MTTVNFKGKDYTLKQEPVMSEDGASYRASAIDSEGNKCEIFWHVAEEGTEDFSNPWHVSY